MRLKMEETSSSPSLDGVGNHARYAAEAVRLLGVGDINSALHYLNLCLDEKHRTTSNKLQTLNSKGDCDETREDLNENQISPADEVSLLEKRCLIHMKLQHFDEVLNDARRILDTRTDHSLAYKCLLVSLCKTNRLGQVSEILKLWRVSSPQDIDMMECRTKLEALILAVKNGIDSVDAFSNIEDQLGLSYDWLLARKLQDPRWRYRALPPGQISFSLCLPFRFGHCPLGAKCSDAHGADELEEWKNRCTLKSVSQLLDTIQRPEIYLNKLLVRLKEANDDTRILTEILPDGMIIKCSKPLHATVQLVQGKKTKVYKWTFGVETMKPLKYLCLLNEIHREYFFISSATIQAIHGHKNKVNLIGESRKAHNEVQAIEISSPTVLAMTGKKSSFITYKLEVKFKPEVYGNFRQTVVFDDGDDMKFVRNIAVDVVPQEGPQSSETTDVCSSPTFDNSSEYRFGGAWNFENADLVDGSTGEKVDLNKLGFTFANGSSTVFPSALVEPLTKQNYKERMRFFLTQEERARQEILAKYNLTAPLTLTENYVMTSGFNEGLTRYAIDGSFYGRMTLFRDVSEDTAVGRLILRSCNYLLLTKTEEVRKGSENGKLKVYLCPIADKTKNNIYVDVGPACVKDLKLNDNDVALFDIQFQLDRTSFMEMKSVIDKLEEFHLDMLFPDFSIDHHIPWSPIKQWGDDPETNVKLNPRQKESLIAITSEDYQIPPILVIGPFGTGKTFTLAQCIRKLLTQSGTRIMICTHSNSAADLYIKEYLDKEVQEGFLEAKPLRIYYHLRNLNSVHPDVLQYCLVENLKFRSPTLEEVMSHRVIVVTLSTSYMLMHMGLPKDTFSHILLDEAAQAMESEAITPLMCAGEGTKLVLAGDHMQLSPELFSDEAKSLHPSLLERLHNYYPETHPCKLMLCENYRSHSSVIDFVSEAFYSKKLQCSMVQPVHDTFYPLTFFSARGEEVQEKDSTSYYNMAEVFEIVDKVSSLVSSWPESWGDYRNESAIGVLTPYSDQVSRIRMALRKKGLYTVSVERVLNVQGKQFRAVFLSTVRSFRPWVKILPEAVGNEVDLGFFSNPKLLNTALTRTQSLVAVVGDPVSLCSEGKCRNLWKDFISVCHKNKSLYGISYTQLEQNILGIEMRMTWGLNPLADVFEPKKQPTDYFQAIALAAGMKSKPIDPDNFVRKVLPSEPEATSHRAATTVCSDVSNSTPAMHTSNSQETTFRPQNMMVLPQRFQMSRPLGGGAMFASPNINHNHFGWRPPPPFAQLRFAPPNVGIGPPVPMAYPAYHHPAIQMQHAVPQQMMVPIRNFHPSVVVEDPHCPPPHPMLLPQPYRYIRREIRPMQNARPSHPRQPAMISYNRQNFPPLPSQLNNGPPQSHSGMERGHSGAALPYREQPGTSIPPYNPNTQNYFGQQIKVNQEEYAAGVPLFQSPPVPVLHHNSHSPTPRQKPGTIPAHQNRNSVTGNCVEDNATSDSGIEQLSVGELVKFKHMLEKYSITDRSQETENLLVKVQEAIAHARSCSNFSMQEQITAVPSLGRNIWNSTESMSSASLPSMSPNPRGTSISQQVNDSQISNAVEDIWANLGFSDPDPPRIPTPSIREPPVSNHKQMTHNLNPPNIVGPYIPSPQELFNGRTRDPYGVAPPFTNIVPNGNAAEVPLFGGLTAQLSSNSMELQSSSSHQDPFESGRSYANVAKRAVITTAVGPGITSTPPIPSNNVGYNYGGNMHVFNPNLELNPQLYQYPPVRNNNVGTRAPQQQTMVLPTSVIKEPRSKRNERQ